DDFLTETPQNSCGPSPGSPPKEQIEELKVCVRDLQGKLDANTKTIEANTNQLAECAQQISKLTAMLQIFLKGKS
ncbi:hypothetical protein M5D96_014162, partial [Drosophila gunungcola]